MDIKWPSMYVLCIVRYTYTYDIHVLPILLIVYLIYVIKYSTGYGFPEHHNIHQLQCDEGIKEQNLVLHIRASLTNKC